MKKTAKEPAKKPAKKPADEDHMDDSVPDEQRVISRPSLTRLNTEAIAIELGLWGGGLEGVSKRGLMKMVGIARHDKMLMTSPESGTHVAPHSLFFNNWACES